MNKEITWAPIIPLIGGQMLGAEKAFGKPPETIYSYPDFGANDSHYVNYQTVTKGRDIAYTMIPEAAKRSLDVVSGTPPCAALSQLNTAKAPDAKGAGCEKNEWMYEVFKEGINRFEAKAIIVENAPALFTNKGRPVADKLFDICSKAGYSMTLYKTSTKYHGIPQARDRTFAIGWKSETAPIMDWHKRPRRRFDEYVNDVKDDALHQDLVVNKNLMDEPYYNFVEAMLPPGSNMTARQVIREIAATAFGYVNKSGKIQEANKWMHETGHTRGIHVTDHAIKKFAQGLGVWDASVHVFDDCMNAVIGRNLADTVHPHYDRSLTIREALYLMGFPDDFELLNGMTSMNHIAQNVPVPTSRDMHLQIAKFLNGELPMSETNYLRQNNHTEKTEFDVRGTSNQPTLEEFFA
ncbi:MAG: DNA cytosine methyltransferase [Hellea sp.]|nr:DNA cytosine methyltransferase [Hellea sp.]